MAKGTSRPFDRDLAETICNLEVPKKLQFSPEGNQILYTASLLEKHRKGEHAVSTLWLASTEPGSARQLTSGHSDDTTPTWHPDGKSVAFLSDRSDPGESCAIWTLRLDGGDPRALTPIANKGDIETFAFSPDGETIAYISPDEKEEEKDGSGPDVWGEKWEYARLRLVNVTSGGTSVIVGDDRHVGDLSWSPGGSSIAFSSINNPDIEEAILTGTTISVVNVETGKVTDLCVVPNEVSELTWAPDGKVYFITGHPIDKDLSGRAIYAVDPRADSPAIIKVACGEADDAASLVIAGDKLLVNRDSRLSNIISVVGGHDLFARETEIWAWDVFIDPESREATLAAGLSDINKPYEVFLVREGRSDVKLSDHGKPLNGRVFGSCTVLTCRSTDDEVELDGLYLTPEGASEGPIPTFVMVHGGPNSRNCNSFDAYYFYWANYVLSRGYGVLLPQYRGSSGRGSKFAAYSAGGQGKYDHADVVTITDYAVKSGLADGSRLMVGGWSQGGLLTYLCSVRNGLQDLGWRYNAAVAGAGVSDLESLALSADLGSTYEVELNGGRATWFMDKDDTRNRQGSALWEIAGAMRESRRRGVPVIPPMLILHGGDDDRCPFSQAEGFRRALRAHGLPCEFVKYPGERHLLERQRFWLDMLERIGRWCDLYIGEKTVSGNNEGASKLAIR